MKHLLELLERAAILLRCPACRQSALHGAPLGLNCTSCGRLWPLRSGFIDFLDNSPRRPSLGQRFFLHSASARLYAAVRETPAAWIMNRSTFRDEVNTLFTGLALRPDARALDVPCGHGNFTCEMAGEAPDGLILGADLSEAMLAIAARKVEQAKLRNVLLLRASALDLPLGDQTVDAVASCGGLHLYPDIPQAITEMYRVLACGGRVAGLAFASGQELSHRIFEGAASQVSGITALDFDRLGADFTRVGFRQWNWERRGFIAYFSATT